MTEPVEIDISIPPIFWRSLSLEDCRAIMRRGFLNEGECELLWGLTHRNGPAPHRLPLITPSYKLGMTTQSNIGFMTSILEIGNESGFPLALSCGATAKEAQDKAAMIAAVMSAYQQAKRRPD